MCFLPFCYIIQYAISATSQMSFVQSLLSVAILNANFFYVDVFKV